MFSIVVPLYNEAENIDTFCRRLRAVMERVGEPWELICVNDGSKDDTLSRLVKMHMEDARVQVIDLSRNFGKEAALTAGLDFARGEAIIPIDADLQDPPEIIPELLAKWREGYEVVNATRQIRDGESWLRRATAGAFYRIINRIANVEIPPDTGDFCLISRGALDVLRNMPERRRFMKGLFAWVGFRRAVVTYRRDPRYAGRSKWNYWKLWNFALEGITSFSELPLQIASYFGCLVATTSFVYGFWLFYHTLIHGNPVPGYPSLMVAMLFLGGVQLMALGIIGEYLGRVYQETKHRPIYVVKRSWLANRDLLSDNTTVCRSTLDPVHQRS